MSLVSGFLNTKVDIYSVTRDKYTDVTRTLKYSNVKVRWVETTERVMSADAEEKKSSISVWMLPDYTIDENYEFVKDNKRYKIISYERRKNLDGDEDHVKVYLA